MLNRLWLIFAQTVTMGVALLFVVSTFRPGWLDHVISNTGHPAYLPNVAPTSQARLQGFREAAHRALPSVAYIYTTKTVNKSRNPLLEDPFLRHFFGDRLNPFEEQEDGPEALGSGVIVSENGYVLTNYHVIDGAEDIDLALNDGRHFKVKVVGVDPETDLAVLQIRAPDTSTLRLPAISFAAPDSVQVGDVVLAIGNPFGVGQTVTMGIVSALGRNQLGINTFENFIQTDAAINPGNSGGALTDAEGHLLGINTAIFSRSGGSLGIGFAIPVSSAGKIMEEIIRTGKVTRGWIGVETQEMTQELADSFGLPAEGVLVTGLVRGSPADKSGIRPGDVLLSIAERKMANPQLMLETIASLKPEQTVTAQLRRKNKMLDLKITIGQRPLPAATPE